MTLNKMRDRSPLRGGRPHLLQVDPSRSCCHASSRRAASIASRAQLRAPLTRSCVADTVLTEQIGHRKLGLILPQRTIKGTSINLRRFLSGLFGMVKAFLRQDDKQGSDHAKLKICRSLFRLEQLARGRVNMEKGGPVDTKPPFSILRLLTDVSQAAFSWAFAVSTKAL